MYLEVDEARRAGDKARGREKDAADREVESVPGYSNGKEGRNEDEKRKWDSTDRDCETARIRCKKAMEDKHGEDRTHKRSEALIQGRPGLVVTWGSATVYLGNSNYTNVRFL